MSGALGLPVLAPTHLWTIPAHLRKPGRPFQPSRRGRVLSSLRTRCTSLISYVGHIILKICVQIVLGVAAYGHSFHVNTSAALGGSSTLTPYPPFDKAQQPLGDSDLAGASLSEGSFSHSPCSVVSVLTPHPEFR